MKTQTHYTTSVALAPWMRRNAAALAALLTMTAAIVGLIFALGRFGQSSHTARRDTAARPLIATCRDCANEVLGAAQAAKGRHLAQPSARSTPRQGVAIPRIFQDEVLGADQANLDFLSINAAHRPSEVARALAAPLVRQQIAGPRAFRDEVLGADQANLASLVAPGSAFDQQQGDSLRAGPR
jgi:hypothetical protein